MKGLNGSVLRCIFAIVMGLVLVLWPEAAVTYLVITIGICFIIPGIFSLLNYFTREKVEGEPSPMFPIDGAGSILFGAWLVIMPQFFVSILMYILGALLVIAGAQQIYSLVSARKWSIVPYGFYIIPALILITGIMILAYPFGAAANTFVIFGVACLIYGISELINWYKFRKRFRICFPSQGFIIIKETVRQRSAALYHGYSISYFSIIIIISKFRIEYTNFFTLRQNSHLNSRSIFRRYLISI